MKDIPTGKHLLRLERHVMRNFDEYTNPDAYGYNQAPIEYIDARYERQQQQEYVQVPPGYSRLDNTRHTQGEKLVVPQATRRTKAESLALVGTFKKWLIAASLIGFGVFSALAAGNVVGVTAQNATPQPTNNNPQITSPSQDDNGGGFFQQRQPGGSNFGGNGGGLQGQGPVSGSSVS